MFKKFLCFIVMAVVLCGPVFGQKGGRSYSSGGGRSYSSPSRSYSSPSRSSSTPKSSSSGSKSYSAPKSSYSSGSGSKKSYSSGSSSSSKPKANVSSSSKPSKTSFGSNISSSAKKVESSVKYKAATQPKQTYTTKSGTTKKLDTTDPKVNKVRNTVTHEKYVTYENRTRTFYGNSYAPVYYHDSFSPFLMGWLLSDTLNSHQRAMWMYHHQSDMDSARYNELLAKDAALKAELEALKAQNLQRDPTYVPEQMKTNPDLMYSKEFVDAAYNPVKVESKTYQYGFSISGRTIIYFLGTIGFISLIVYLLFFKEYK